MKFSKKGVQPDVLREPKVDQSDPRPATDFLSDADETIVAQTLNFVEDEKLDPEENRGVDPYNTGQFGPA